MATIVKSAIGDIVAKKELRCSGELFEALDKVFAGMVEKAIARAKDNGRKTLRACDL
jgi:histone H3/H4